MGTAMAMHSTVNSTAIRLAMIWNMILMAFIGLMLGFVCLDYTWYTYMLVLGWPLYHVLCVILFGWESLTRLFGPGNLESHCD